MIPALYVVFQMPSLGKSHGSQGSDRIKSIIINSTLKYYVHLNIRVIDVYRNDLINTFIDEKHLVPRQEK